jgi:hypothetical protein
LSAIAAQKEKADQDEAAKKLKAEQDAIALQKQQ